MNNANNVLADYKKEFEKITLENKEMLAQIEEATQELAEIEKNQTSLNPRHMRWWPRPKVWCP